MFQYRFVENKDTGKKYWIDKSVLTNEEGPRAQGGDWYEIDLQPMDPSEKTICGLDLIDFGDGAVHITKNLNPVRGLEPGGVPSSFKAQTVIAFVRGDTLSVSGDGEEHAPLGKVVSKKLANSTEWLVSAAYRY